MEIELILILTCNNPSVSHAADSSLCTREPFYYTLALTESIFNRSKVFGGVQGDRFV